MEGRSCLHGLALSTVKKRAGAVQQSSLLGARMTLKSLM
jgi:hypothetical protein